MKNKYLEAGKIVNTHGVRGEIMIQSWCDDVETLCSLEYLYKKNALGTYEALHILRASHHKGMALVKIEGLDDLDSAIKLKNTTVYADRDDFELDEGDHFIADILGLDVIDVDTGEKYGVLKSVTHNGANGVYEIDTGRGSSYIPVVDEFVINIDEEKGIFIRPIEGMIE